MSLGLLNDNPLLQGVLAKKRLGRACESAEELLDSEAPCKAPSRTWPLTARQPRASHDWVLGADCAQLRRGQLQFSAPLFSHLRNGNSRETPRRHAFPEANAERVLAALSHRCALGTPDLLHARTAPLTRNPRRPLARRARRPPSERRGNDTLSFIRQTAQAASGGGRRPAFAAVAPAQLHRTATHTIGCGRPRR